MQVRGPLMVEHRLIERMIRLIGKALAGIKSNGRADPRFIEAAVDFIRTYADRTHHGKEEDILFRDLAQRQLADSDRRLMEELIQEHVFGRKTTRALGEANIRYRGGDTAALAEIADRLKALVEFYPKHIAKEDNVFFPAISNYFARDEQQAMQAEFQEFDRKLIHEKYKAVVGGLEKAGFSAAR